MLRALRAALAGQDISADAIRKGADAAEILVDLDDVTVRRAITAKGSTVTVSRGDMKAAKPQAYLAELLGTSAVDPLDLLLLKPRERRARILEVLPCEVTLEQLREWAPELPDGFSAEGHGLEVVERLHKHFYDRRTGANAQAKDSRRLADEAALPLVPYKEPPASADVAGATAELEAAKEKRAGLRARRDQAAAQASRAVGTREKIAELRSKADESEAVPEVDEEEVKGAIAAALSARNVRDAAQKAYDDATQVLESLRIARDRHGEATKAAMAHRQRADELEATLATAAAAPGEDELQRADVEVTEAGNALIAAKEIGDVIEAFGKLTKARDTATAHAKAAKELDEVVRKLREDAPRALLAKSEAIPGLSLEGDDVMLDGVRLDALCGAEQMRLAVEIARRANARSKILVVDGLERLDPEQLDVFVREATRDGWQLIGTRVDRGDVVLEQLELDGKAEAAE